jgi:magnesium-protoporphyrin O-methyltransferase
LDNVFDEKTAQDELRDYRKNGAIESTRLLIDALIARGVSGLTLIDIGGGVGAIQHELLRGGAEQAVAVDASTAYLKAARAEAERLGHAAQTTFFHGDFVALADQIDPADIVTLDRVICCYPDAQALVGQSAARAKRFYGLVFPHDSLLFRGARPLINGYYWITRNPYRFYLHTTQAVESILAGFGFRRAFRKTTFFWQVMVYERG